MPNFATTTPYSDPKTYFRGRSFLICSHSASGKGTADQEANHYRSVCLHFLPEGGHGMDSVGVDMELDVVPCSQAQDDLSLAFPPITPSTSASPLQPITSSPQRTSWHLPTFFTPEPVRVSQQQVPSSATPSDLRESHDAHIMRIEAPHVPLFTLSSSSYIEERPQSTESMPPSSSFPRCILPVMSTIYHLSSLQ
jgi:hypothetical protein